MHNFVSNQSWGEPRRSFFQTGRVSQQRPLLARKTTPSRKNLVLLFLCGVCGLLFMNLAAWAQTVQRNPEVIPTLQHDVSPPLRDIPPVIAPRAEAEAEPARRIPRPPSVPGLIDPVLQRSYGPERLMPTPSANFAGIGNGFSGPAGSFTVQSAPPDTNMAVGPNGIVQIVNTSFAVFNKTGTAALGPVGINTVWAGFGGGCQTNNDGDPVVQYDKIADRWIISQFSVSTTPFLECVAVSTTPDPTGTYARYSFNYGNSDFPDYPKLSVWPDAYYVTYNIFSGGSTFAGARVCAFDRSKMLAGAAATQVCFNTGTSFGGVLTADLDGGTLPSAGSPSYVLGLGTSATTLAFWKFHVDFITPGNSTFTGPTTLTVPSYAEACSGGTCIPQTGTTQQLDSLADRLMYRLAYRNFGDHEALVVNHSVTAGSSAGVRWYELRLDGSHNASVFQQGTYAPDASFRWMGSIAQDQQGNMGLGFSVSSSSLHPEIHYTGRLAGDAAGQMPQGEATIINGAGSQTGSSLSRWGDYSAMRIDPSDDCTFWYTTEYIPANGAFNWSTRIASFKFPSCGGNLITHFAVTAPGSSPAGAPFSVTVTALDAGNVTVTGYTGTVHFAATGSSSLPADYTFVPGDNGSHTFTSGVTLNTSGNQTVTVNDTTDVSVTGSTGVTVVAPPTINTSFGAPSVALAGTVSLSFTIHNPNSGTTLTGVGFSDTLPAGLVISTPNGLAGSCGGGTITATQNTSVISLSGALLAAGASCNFSVNVTGIAAGTQNNTTGNVSSTEGGAGGTASASVKVEAPPSIAAVFNPSAIALNATSSLKFTITNPAANVDALTGVAFSDTLPSGLTVASASASTCGGTLTTTAPTGIALTGATINANSQCQFSVTVTGASAGNYNTTGNVTSTNGGTGNTASASLSVGLSADISVTLTAIPYPVAAIGGRLQFIAKVTNNGPNTADVTFTETFSGNLAVSSVSGCSGTAPVACTLAGMTLGESRQVTVIVTPLVGRNITANVTVAPVTVPDPDNTNNSDSKTVKIRFKPQRF
jgi:uncharacterized repeat protein (TIGR01451 family)